MALDLGTLFAQVDLETRAFDQKLARVETRLRAAGGTKVPDIALGADVSRVDAAISKAVAAVRSLNGLDAEVTVAADTGQADAALSGVEAQARSLPDAELQVTADTSSVDGALGDLEGTAGAAGRAGGEAAGEGLVDGITDATSSLSAKGGPIVGSVIGAIGLLASLSPGVAIMDAITKGMDAQASKSLFSAKTGLDAASAARFGAAAGESYAQNFGDSIEGNLDSARTALQAGLLGGDATQTEITGVVNGLSTVSTILGEDVPRVARSAAQAIKTGIAGDAAGAFDLLVKGQQAGLNSSEDLLDTVDEYSTQFRKLGLDGPVAFGLLSQAVKAGARDTDVAADAIKEFAIRAVDGSTLSAEGFAALGLNAGEMSAQIAAGGAGAAAGLDTVLDKLRAIEDPVTRDAAAVALFGTQAEDLGAALFAMDASTAVDQLGQVAGAAKTASDAIAANPAAAVETAKRSIEVSARGIQEALAVGFGPLAGQVAEYVSSNREAVIGFLLETGNTAFDVARSLGEMASAGLRAGATLIEGFGTVSASIQDSLATILTAADIAFGWIPGVGDDLSLASAKFSVLSKHSNDTSQTVADGMRGAADSIDGTLLPALGFAQGKFEEFGIPAKAQAALSDATANAASSIQNVGLAVDGALVSFDNATGAFDTTTDAGARLDGQLRAAAAGMQEAATAGARAGQGADELTAAADASREALVGQLEQLGLSREGAERLADQYANVPELVSTTVQDVGLDAARERASGYDEVLRNVRPIVPTTVQLNSDSAQNRISGYDESVRKVPPATNTTVRLNGTESATAKIAGLLTRLNSLDGKSVTTFVKQVIQGGILSNPLLRADGGMIPLGLGGPREDNVPAWLSSGEFVINAAATSKHLPLLKAINAQKLADGGVVGVGSPATVTRQLLLDDLAVRPGPVSGARYDSALREEATAAGAAATAEARLTQVREDGQATLERLREELDILAETTRESAAAEVDAESERVAAVKDSHRDQLDALRDRQREELAAYRETTDDKAAIAAAERAQRATADALEATQKGELEAAEDRLTQLKKDHAVAEKTLRKETEARVEAQEDANTAAQTTAEDALTAAKDQARAATEELTGAERELDEARATALATARDVAGSLSRGGALGALLGDTSARDLTAAAVALADATEAAAVAGRAVRGESRGGARDRRVQALADLAGQAGAYAGAQEAAGVGPVAVRAGLDQQIARITELGRAYGLTAAEVKGFTGALTDRGTSAGDLLRSSQRELAQVREMGSLIAQLRGAGLDDGLLSELASQGTGGLSTARALIDGGPEVLAELSATRGEITSLSDEIGAEFAAALYDPSRVSRVGVDGDVSLDAVTLSDLADRLGRVIAANPPVVTLDGARVSKLLGQRAADAAYAGKAP